ncbi:Ig-like domain-containing protein [Bacteroides salyersiae]|nr:Ig-like domain-containing protein [Bacteroides salyersiae]
MFCPKGAIFPAIRWSVDDESIARVDNQGIVYPKTNGKVKVTASIVYDEKTLSDEIEINISGQLGSAHFTGTAVEEDAEMQMITDLQGTITNLFEIYTSLRGTGSFSFYRDLGNDKKVVYGKGKG